MRFILTVAMALGLSLSTSSQTQADIIIDVTGTPGSGTTTWSFSGSATVGGGTIRIDDDDFDVSFGWVVGSAFYSGSNFNIDFTTTTATFSSGGVTFDILGVGAESSSPDELFGIAIDDANASSSNYPFASGTALTSFSGSGTAPVDINDFAAGATSATDWNNSLSLNQGTLPVTFNVGGGGAAIPEPSSLILLSMACGAAVCARRRRKKSTPEESLGT